MRTVLSLWRGPLVIRNEAEGRYDEGRYDIARRVAASHGLKLSDLQTSSRAPRFCRARWEAWAEMAATGRWSLSMMARVFNRADHTTVRHGLARYREALAA
jgi:chromosomal replication initiation ATPase DnaA